LAEEVKLDKPVTWDQFSKSFYDKFFPIMAQREWENNLSDCSNRTNQSTNMSQSS